MGSNGKQHLDQIIIFIIYNLQLQWIPMGSNGKHLTEKHRKSWTLESDYSYPHLQSPTPMVPNGKQVLDKIIIILIFNIQLQWTPMDSNGLRSLDIRRQGTSG